VAAVTAAFGDPTRREIYLHVRSKPATTASEVAAAFSLHPNVARHHLDRLAAGGYLEVTLERSPTAGAGRPSKRYTAADDATSDPTVEMLAPRDDLLVSLLGEALTMLGAEEAEGWPNESESSTAVDLQSAWSPERDNAHSELRCTRSQTP
jgi:predicted ArsR family transcriptional regulator